MKKKCLLGLLIVFGLFIFTGCESKTDLVLNEDFFARGSYVGKTFDTSKRGYYIDTLNQPNAPYYYVICMGKQNTGGYYFKIDEIYEKGGKTVIVLEEAAPAKKDKVTMAITEPSIILEFPKKPKNIVIKNTKGKEYSKLN